MQKFKWFITNEEINGSLIERLIKSRFGDDFDVENFLQSDFVLADPFLLPDMKKGVERIKTAITKKEKVAIFGDYDVDGVTACALMWELFKFLDLDVQVYIPDRFTEGYGLREGSLKRLMDSGISLVITVDCGIRDVDLIRKMTEKGLDIIVTDHHSVGDKIPECVAVINPKRKTNMYPEINLAGVGVAYCLVRALLIDLEIEEKKREWFEKWNLDLVAIGTVADMMELTNENRILVKYGLKVLQKTRRIGLRKLLELADFESNKIDSRGIGFTIAPRLNAAGRLDKAVAAFQLLIENGEQEVSILAANLNNFNSKRKTETEKVLQQLYSRINDEYLPAVIIECDPEWSKGLVGLASSRAMEKYNRPVFLASLDDKNISGSARGMSCVNVVKMLDQVSDILEHYGGHSMAGGFTMQKEKWDDFKTRISEAVQREIAGQDISKVLLIDQMARLTEINLDIWDIWSKLEPFGIGNMEPVFLSKNLQLMSLKIIGKKNDHLKMDMMQDGEKKSVLWWNAASYYKQLEIGKKYDLAYKISFNEYRNIKNIDLICVDIHKL